MPIYLGDDGVPQFNPEAEALFELGYYWAHVYRRLMDARYRVGPDLTPTESHTLRADAQAMFRVAMRLRADLRAEAA